MILQSRPKAFANCHEETVEKAGFGFWEQDMHDFAPTNSYK